MSKEEYEGAKGIIMRIIDGKLKEIDELEYEVRNLRKSLRMLDYRILNELDGELNGDAVEKPDKCSKHSYFQ